MPADHPFRSIRLFVNEALVRLNGLFNAIYADTGRESISPEKLMRALTLDGCANGRDTCTQAVEFPIRHALTFFLCKISGANDNVLDNAEKTSLKWNIHGCEKNITNQDKI